jgi:hypothetical protein
MSKHVITMAVVLCTLVASFALANLGDIVGSFPSPGPYPRALATTGKYLYVFCYDPPYIIYRVNPQNGSVLSSYFSPFGEKTEGLGFQYGGYLWTSRRGNAYEDVKIAKCYEANGSVLSFFIVSGHKYCRGLACQGNPARPGILKAIISNFYDDYKIMRHNPNGNLLNQFNYSSGLSLQDQAWDYYNEIIWLPDKTTNAHPKMRGFGIGGKEISFFRGPAPSPWGATYFERYLWISTSSGADHTIYKVHCPSIWPAVAPTSLGRVKALFR